MAEHSAAMGEWVTRVLGVRLAPAGDVSVARLEAARPAEAPRTAMTGSLLSAMARVEPKPAAELPAVLSGLIPQFLLAIQNEPHMAAEPMVSGGAMPAQDQVLGVADGLNAVLRSARRWEALLQEAEQGDATLDTMQADRDAAKQDEYDDLVGSYNATRLAALAEEARCMKLAAALATEFRALQSGAVQGTSGR